MCKVMDLSWLLRSSIKNLDLSAEIRTLICERTQQAFTSEEIKNENIELESVAVWAENLERVIATIEFLPKESTIEIKPDLVGTLKEVECSEYSRCLDDVEIKAEHGRRDLSKNAAVLRVYSTAKKAYFKANTEEDQLAILGSFTLAYRLDSNPTPENAKKLRDNANSAPGKSNYYKQFAAALLALTGIVMMSVISGGLVPGMLVLGCGLFAIKKTRREGLSKALIELADETPLLEDEIPLNEEPSRCCS